MNLEIVPSPRQDWCGACKMEHGYDCPLDKKQGMKLWVDDIRTPPDDSWHICRDVNSAIRAIDMFGTDITEINLDHDISHQVVLGGMSRPYPCNETFEAVARYIKQVKIHIEYVADDEKTEAAPTWPVKVRLHTSNPVGAQKMQAILREAGIEPEIVIAKGANRLETIL